jgi:hypothetical protein
VWEVVTHLDDRKSRDDRGSESEVLQAGTASVLTRSEAEDRAGTNLDDLVVLVVVDTEEGERKDRSSGDVTATVAEGVTLQWDELVGCQWLGSGEKTYDSRDGEEGLGSDHEDAGEDGRVRVVTAVGEEGEARDEDGHDRPRVPQAEGEVDEERVSKTLGLVVSAEGVVDCRDGRCEEEGEDEGNDEVAGDEDVDLASRGENENGGLERE